MKQLEQVLQLYREKYFDFNVQHFHEKLREQHGIGFSYTWVKTALQEAGLVARRKKPGSHRKRRPRRPLPGMLLHIDGSEHRWFGDGRKYELIVILDDATSQIFLRSTGGSREHLDGAGGAARGDPYTRCIARCTAIGPATFL